MNWETKPQFWILLAGKPPRVDRLTYNEIHRISIAEVFMFERYTEPARRVVFFARYEASQFGSTTIETEHLLLGLGREDKTLLNRFLGPGSSSESLRKELESCMTIRQKVSTSIDLPISDECKRILARAYEEADQLGHRHIGTEHLLLGILGEENCLAAKVLFGRGLRPDVIREGVRQSSPVPEQVPHWHEGPPLTPELANPLLLAASQEARALKHWPPQPGHFLLGLLRDPNSPIAQFLLQHGITADEVRTKLLS